MWWALLGGVCSAWTIWLILSTARVSEEERDSWRYLARMIFLEALFITAIYAIVISAR